ncbi:hypothetical protein ACHAXR_011824 [Thalassiosira sp. AJA248-18]
MSHHEAEHDYIFGFGSIMNTSTHATWQSPEKKKSGNTIPGAVVTIKRSFGYARKWNFRSTTGFTALGVIAAEDEDEASDINGVLYQVPKEEMPNFDRREVGYKKVEVPLKFLEFRAADIANSGESTTTTTPQTKFCFGPNDKIWLYVPLPSQTMYSDENHPILQSYVDTVLQGCLEWGGQPMAEEFILTTGGWSCFYLNDTPSSRRPWLFRKQYATIDQILSKHSQLTNYGDRRHPEEFASAFNQRMKGTWSLPRRNPNFTGRERELDELRSRFSSQEMGRQRIVVRVEVVAMGGVGKTQLTTEYCYRHFPSEYGLVVWLNAETFDTLVTDYRQLLADLANIDADMDKSTDEIVGEVISRLFRSNVPWLLVFDNIENHDLLNRFVPRGAGTKGHVLVTTRHREAESGVDTLSLGCFHTSEAIELLRRSAGSHNMEGLSNAAAAEELCEKLGNLPLALSMAASYMRQCDVQCEEYLHRYNASEKNGQTLLRQGKLLDYSLTVASSLSLILPKIAEENQTASEVLHLLSFLGPDQITKPILRHLLSAKSNLDEQLSEKKRKATLKKRISTHGSLICCGLILGGTALMLPTINRQRAGMVAVLAMATTSILLFSREDANDASYGEPETTQTSMKRSPSASSSFSAFEYEQSDASWDILKSFSLLSVKEGKGSVHRLLQQAMRACQSEEERVYYLTICIDAVASCWSFKHEENRTWKLSLTMLEHIKSVVESYYHLSTDCQNCDLTLKVATLSRDCGVLSAMALNAFVEAQASLELSLKLLERATLAKKRPEFRKARAVSLYELSKIHRYQGFYDKAHRCLMDSLGLNNADDCLTADTLHELGILEVKKHNLDSAASFLQQSLKIRRSFHCDQINANSAATLHQLAAIHVARKPPSLDKAKTLLQEALSLSRQIGQRAATLKQIARVTIRQGSLDQAESYLEQALELYLELYGDNKLHINVAAVKFQQGALALQRELFDEAWRRFYECLRIRRHVYAYARVGCSTEDTNPIHFEVSCVLHELGAAGFAQKRFSQSMEMLLAERTILERLEEQVATHNDRIYQARLTNLTWLKKCAKEMGDDNKSILYSNERQTLKKREGQKSTKERHQLQSGSVKVQQKVLQCRLLARKFALEQKESGTHKEELLASLEELLEEISVVSSGPMKQASTKFRDTLLLWVDKPGRRSPILTACDSLRDVLRAHGVQVNDSIYSKKKSRD